MRPSVWLGLLPACFLPLLLTGCSLSPSPDATPLPEAGMALHGVAYGGEAPLTGAHVYLLEANTAGYGGPGIAATSANKSISLLTNVPGSTTIDTNGSYYVTTDTAGFWSITSDYTCTPNDQVYLYLLGGSQGGVPNSAAGLLAALGNCPSGGTFSPSLYIVINEVSTIATAYAFAGFATDATHVSSRGSFLSAIGIKTAFANAANMATLFGTGGGVALATTPGGNGTVPQTEINTLANILSSCVGSSGPSSASCTTLFADAESGGSTGTAATDTATAAINIAHNPGANVAALYALSLGTPPFGPALTSAPNDFTIALNYTGGGVSSPTAIAIDEFGDAWITDNGSTASVTELSPVGVALNSSPFTVGGLQSPTGIAIDLNGNALITNDFYPGSVTALTSTGTVLGSAFTGNGLNEPDAVAVDSSNHIWVANAGQLQNGQMSEFNESGNTIGSSPFGPTFGNIEAAVAVDLSGNLWTINAYIESPQLYAFSGGALVSANTYAPINNPTGLAIDASNRVWYSTHGSNVVVMNNDGTSKSTAYSGGGLQYSQAIAMDGASNAWIANTTFTAPDPGLLSEFSNSGTAITSSTGYKSSTMLAPSGIAVDGSGDVWVINKGNSTVSEFIGAAVPVITPFAYALQVGQLGSEP